MALEVLIQESVWLDKARYADAERIFYEKLSKEKIEARRKSSVQNSLADICESKSLKKEKLKKILMSELKSRNISQCDNFSLCDQVAKYHKCNNFSELLSSVEQWDLKVPQNQYKSINSFECFVCCFKTNKFNKWKIHIMSISHMSDCHKIKDLYSYVCSSKECKVLLYGPEKLLFIHRAKHFESENIIGVPILMAEVMKRFITKQNNIMYFCSHCKKYAEKAIHSSSEKSNSYIKCPVEYYCKYCRVDFYSSPEMIDYHLLTVEHMTLKCFEKLCLEAKMNHKHIKIYEQSNKKEKKNLLPTKKNEIITNSLPLPRIQDISLFKNSDCIEVTNKHMQTVQVNKSPINADVGSTIILGQKSQQEPLNNSLEKSDINIHKISSESYDNKSSHEKKCAKYTEYFKRKMDILNLLRQYKKHFLKTLAYYCNVCDFITEEKYIWDKHILNEYSCATNRPTIHCSICSMIIVGVTYEEHSHTIEHCTLLKFEQSIEPIVDDLIKLADSSKLDETFVDSEQNESLHLNKMNNTEAEILDNSNSENNCHNNNDCTLKIVSKSKSKNPIITKTLSSDKNIDQNKHIKSDEVLGSVNSKTNPNKIIDGQSKLDVASICGKKDMGNVTNLENEKADILDEDKAYGDYVMKRLKNIKNSTVKQDIQFEIDYIFYTQVKKLKQENV